MIHPDYQHSIDFLQRWRPDGPWVLIATDPERKELPVVQTFTSQDPEEDNALRFLERYGETKNLYFAVNPTRRPVYKKASREDVKEMVCLHVDLDPGKPPEGATPAEWVAQERERLLGQLREPPGSVPPPSVIVDSGGGYWGFWLLDEPFQIDGVPERYEDAARYNQQLELDFEADNCHNVDRIARLPGTINRPDAKKRAKGRMEARAELLEWHEDRVYPLSRFKAAAPKAEVQSGLVELSDEILEASVDDLPEAVPLLCRIVIVQGHDPDHPDRWGGDRSAAVWWVCCELTRAGCSDDVIYSVITNKAHGISDHVFDQSNPQKYAIRQIERAKEEAIQPELRELNERHAVILNVNGKTRVLSEIPDPEMGRPQVTFQTFEDVRNSYMNRSVDVVTTDSKGNTIPKSIPLGHWWLQHPNRRQYTTVTFSPGGDVAGCYNLWRGFAYEARAGSCELFLAHVRDNVCDGNEEHYRYLMGWCARAVQRPDEQGHVAVVLRGGRGVGKGKFASTIMRLFGRHGVPVSNPEHLTGKFNAHLRDCVLLFGDEAFAARDKRHESVLKALVTEDMLISEQKGFDAKPSRNFTHIVLASNEDWVVPSGKDERRFFVLDVAEHHKQDRAYFAAIQRELDGGGYEALLHFLLHYDITDYNVRDVPQTKALLDQKIRSMSAMDEWWLSILQDGDLFGEGWPRYVARQNFRHEFSNYCRDCGIKRSFSDNELRTFLDRVLPGGVIDRRVRGRVTIRQADGSAREVERARVYELPPLPDCRAHFSAALGGGLDWAADDAVEPEVELVDHDAF